VTVEFLVQFDITIPGGTSPGDVEVRERAEAATAAELAEQGHVLRVWRLAGDGPTRVLGLYRAEDRRQLDGLLASLPLREWMQVTVTTLDPHPDDPDTLEARRAGPVTAGGLPAPGLPAPGLALVYRLEATLGQPLDLGATAQGHRRIVPLTGGTFTGPELSGTLVAGASADWQTVLPDGTALGDVRYTLRTDRGDLLDVRSRGVRHGDPEVLSRLGRGEDVDASEYTFRTSTRVETAAPGLDWLNKGIFVGVGGRGPGAVVYETYLVA
jgi:muconolactone delta-isomerase